MRFRKLHLTAYGPFTDKEIDFECKVPGLHIVYGANEAGKSATLSAITDLLFGIEERTRYTFVHKGANLRIEAILENSDGTIQEIIRRKGRSNTLLDGDENSISEDVIEKYMPGINRDLFTTLFGMSHAILIQGGKQIVSGEGEIGQSLFSAGAGITGMSSIINDLAQESGELFKPSASKPRINVLITEYKLAGKERNDKVLSASDWKKHDNALKLTLEKRGLLEVEIKQVSMEYQRLERISKAIPGITTYKQLMHEIAETGDVVLVAEGFQQERIKVQERQNQAETVEAQLEKDIENVRKEMGSIDLANSLLENQNEIDELFQSSGSYRKEMRDLPGIKSKNYSALEGAEKILKELKPELSLEKADTLKVSTAKHARITELGRKIDPLVERLTSAENSKSTLEARMITFSEALSKLAPERDSTLLEQSIENARKEGNLAKALLENETLVKQQENKITTEIERLGLWHGLPEELIKVALPTDETITHFESEFDKLHIDLAKMEKEESEQSLKIKNVKEQINILNAGGMVPGEEDLVSARDRRDGVWQLVVETLRTGKFNKDKLKEYDPEAEEIVDAFEKVMKSCDDISDTLRSESDRVATMGTLHSQLENLEAGLKQTDSKIEGARSKAGEVDKRWKGVWTGLKIDALSPKEMRAWLRNCLKIVDLIENAAEMKMKTSQLEMTISHHAGVIGACLEVHGVAKNKSKGEIDNVLGLAGNLLKTIEKNNMSRKSCESDIARMTEEIGKCDQLILQTREEIKRWQEQWAENIRQLGLNEKSRPVEVDVVLDLTKSLFEKLDHSHELQGRIKAIEKNIVSFRMQAKQLCNILEVDFDDDKADKSITVVNHQLKAALQDATRLENLRKSEKDIIARLSKQQETRKQETARLKAMCEEARCTDITELPGIEEKSSMMRRNKLKLDELREMLVQFSAGQGHDALIIEAEGVNPDSLPGDMENINNRLEELHVRKSETDREIGSEETTLKTMKGGLDAAELAEKAQGLLASITTESERYVVLRVAESILRMEIERYRKENQGPVLEEAGNIFRTITLNSFEGLVPDFGENDEQVLRGVRNGGEKIGVEAMSDGTCDQLYLALRLACIRHRLKSNEPVPIILDDILVNFDDERSASTLQILAELAKQTQVIFFTHHKHLMELAEKAVSSSVLKLHTLE